MKIALFTETYLPEVNGVVTHVKVLKEGLEKLGHEVLVVTADADAKEHFIKDNILHCPGIRIKKFYNYGVALPIVKPRLELLKTFNPDIIHVHQEFGIGLSGLKIAKELNKPLVYTLHTIYDDYIHYVCPDPLLKVTKNISYKYVQFITKKTNYITSPSNKGVEYLSHAGVKTSVKVIPNSAELDVFINNKICEEEKITLSEKYNIPNDATKICFVGRLGKEKNVDTLINFWSNTVSVKDNLHLIIIGDGPELKSLKDLTKKLNCNTITFTGKIEHINLPPYLSFCDGYITTSLSDTNSISMLEGMASGLPVFCLSDPLNEGQVVNGKNGFIFNNENEMYIELKKFQNMNDDEQERLSKNVIDSVSNNGSIQLAKNILPVYEEAIKNPITKEPFTLPLKLHLPLPLPTRYTHNLKDKFRK